MPEWWTYRPEDLLLFSPRVYWRMVELHNAAAWPLHLATFAAGLAATLSVGLRPRGLFAALVLGATWLLVGGYFLWHRYSSINWTMAWVVPAFGLQALMLAAGGAVRGGVAFDRSSTAGTLLAAAGLLAYPFVPPLFGRPLTAAEVFGIAPDPTAIVTLRLLLLARGRLVPLLYPVPLLWLLLSGLTLLTMDDPQGWLPLSAAGTVVVTIAARRFAGMAR